MKAKSTCRIEKMHLGHLQKYIEAKQLNKIYINDINVGFFNRYKQFRYAQGIATDTVKKELGTFHCLFKMAEEHGYIEENIVPKVTRDKSQATKDRYKTLHEISNIKASRNLSEKELKKMRKLCYLNEIEMEELIALAEGKWIHPILKIYANTGMRRGSLQNLHGVI